MKGVEENRREFNECKEFKEFREWWLNGFMGTKNRTREDGGEAKGVKGIESNGVEGRIRCIASEEMWDVLFGREILVVVIWNRDPNIYNIDVRICL